MATGFVMYRGSVIAEQARLDDDAYTHGGVKFLVGKKTFAIAVIELEKQTLIVALEQPVAYFKDGVVI